MQFLVRAPLDAAVSPRDCRKQAMVALVLADVLMQQKAQCELFPAGALETLETNPLGKKLSEGVAAHSP